MKKISRREFVKKAGLMTSTLSLSPYLLMGGCKQSYDSDNNDKSAMKKLTLQAAWVNDAEFTGYFVAMDNKYYEDENIDLKYLSGGPEVIPEASLLSNKADIALTTPDTTVNLIIKDKIPLKIIGTQYQKSPLGIVSLRDSNIKNPKDLENKTLAVPPVNIISVEALLKLNDVDERLVNIVPYQYDPTPLISGAVDATVDFTTNVPYTIKLSGLEPYSFLMYDFGFTIYNDTIVVTEETLRDKKDELIGFLRASRKGWKENFRNPEIYPKKFMKTHFKNNGRTLENEIYFNKKQEKLMISDGGMFFMSERGIEGNIRALRSIGLDATKDMFVTDLINQV